MLFLVLEVMSSNLDPAWTESLGSRIVDPLQIDRVRNRLLTNLIWGVVSIAITQRLRYISFFLWCLDNIEEPTSRDVVPFEKIFLLANIAHEHDGRKDRGETGLSGSGRVPWEPSELRESSTSFPISDDSFEIQSGGSSGFSSYYNSILERLLLTKGLEPTPLGKSIADEFDNEVDVEFRKLERAVSNEEVDSELIQRFTDACCCSLDGREEKLLRKAYFGVIDPSRSYEDLNWKDSRETKDLALDSDLTELDLVGSIDTEGAIDVDEYLERYFGGSFGAKMKESFVLFLWISAQQGDYGKSLDEVERLDDIREMWRLYRYYDYFDYGCEALLSAVLQALEDKGSSVHPDALLDDLVSKEVYSRTVSAVLEGVSTENIGDQDALEAAFQYVYYGKPTGHNTRVDSGSSAQRFDGSWSYMLEEIEGKMDPGSFDSLSELSEWKLKHLIKKETDSPTSVESSSRVFAYVVVLFALLKLRHEHVFSDEEYKDYWNWFSKFETKPPGPVSLLKSLEHDDTDLESFMRKIADRWVIQRYDEALYQKMDSSRMPLLYSKDFTGSIEYRDYYSPRLSDIKFNRLVDILYELDLIDEPNTNSFGISTKGQRVLDEMMEVSK